MKEEDYRAHFYATIIVPIKSEFYNTDNISDANYVNTSALRNRELPPVYFLFQKRPQFQHQFQRTRFIENRDRYIAMYKNGVFYHIMTEKRKTDELLLYKKNIEAMFPEDYEKVVNLLKEMLEKFYKVRVREKSTVVYFDSNNGRYEESGRFRTVS